MSEKKTINGVDIVEDWNVTHFTISDEVKKEDERKRQEELDANAEKPSSWLAKIIKWFKTSKVTPYVKTSDLADPFGDRNADWTDMDAGNDGKTAVEVGIKVRF